MDIITTVTVRGKPCIAAFINKGKGTQKVTNKRIADQISDLRRVPKLGLAVLCAVGHIHDDAQENFTATAIDRGADFLIMGAMATARLLIAYEKICPEDGTLYNKKGVCCHGHIRDDGTTISWRVRAEATSEQFHLKDVSTLNAKRYSASLLIDRHYDRTIIRKLVREATEQLKTETYQRPGAMEQLWANHRANVIWTYVGRTIADIQRGNWFCRSFWLDESLAPEFQPFPLGGDEVVEGVEFVWNADYEANVAFVARHQASKGAIVQMLQEISGQLDSFANLAIRGFEAFTDGQMVEMDFAKDLQPHAATVRELFLKTGDLPFGPADTTEAVDLIELLAGSVDEFFDSYTERSISETSPIQRQIRFELALSCFKKDAVRWAVAWEKLHHG